MYGGSLWYCFFQNRVEMNVNNFRDEVAKIINKLFFGYCLKRAFDD